MNVFICPTAHADRFAFLRSNWCSKRRYWIRSHRQLIGALKHFFDLFRETRIRNPDLVRRKRSRYMHTVFSQEEVMGLLQRTTHLKHRAVLALIYSTGLRISELAESGIKRHRLGRTPPADDRSLVVRLVADTSHEGMIRFKLSYPSPIAKGTPPTKGLNNLRIRLKKLYDETSSLHLKFEENDQQTIIMSIPKEVKHENESYHH